MHEFVKHGSKSNQTAASSEDFSVLPDRLKVLGDVLSEDEIQAINGTKAGVHIERTPAGSGTCVSCLSIPLHYAEFGNLMSSVRRSDYTLPLSGLVIRTGTLIGIVGAHSLYIHHIK
jgi:hypothetical protein